MKSIEIIDERIKILKMQIEYYRTEYDKCDANDSQGQLHAMEQISKDTRELVNLENLKKRIEE